MLQILQQISAEKTQMLQFVAEALHRKRLQSIKTFLFKYVFGQAKKVEPKPRRAAPDTSLSHRRVMSKPLVSVVMPVFDAAPFLERAVQSVLGQTCENHELLCVEDHSTDDSWLILQRLAAADTRVRLFRTPRNAGPAVSRNMAIEAARGDYIAFLDADDEWATDKLQHQIAFMQANDVLLSYCDYVERNESGKEIGFVRAPAQVDHRYLMQTNAIGCSTACYNARRLGKVFMPPMRKRQDWGLWLLITKNGAVGHNFGHPSVYYTVRTNSVSSNKFQAIAWNWRLYRDVLGLTWPAAALLLPMFFYRTGMKYVRKRLGRL